MSDLFDEVIDIDSSLIAEGEEAGRVDGHKAAVLTGMNLGIMKGWEVGLELGFYLGACEVLIDKIDELAEEGKRGRVRKSIMSIMRIVGEVDGGDEDIMKKVLLCRGKFKVVRIALGLVEELDLGALLTKAGGGEQSANSAVGTGAVKGLTEDDSEW